MANQTTHLVPKLWIILGVSLLFSFGLLLLIGREIYQVAPPIPATVVTTSNQVVYTNADIHKGQSVWQSLGGMQQGSIWGHGSYVAPDWSADWLQREALALLEILGQRNPMPGVSPEVNQATLLAMLRKEMRTNTYDPASQQITVSEARARAIQHVAKHYSELYTAANAQALKLRTDYAMPLHSVLNTGEAHALGAFFFWTAWATSTNRPGEQFSYTSNWPHEPLIDNKPTPGIFMWSVISIVLLLAGIGAIVWYYVRQYDQWREELEPEGGVRKTDFLEQIRLTPSMRSTAKYFWLVTTLFVIQVLLGMVTAHYAVEGQGLYGLPLAEYLPYSVTRTWHTQLAVYWIATAWLAAGLYVAPLISGRDPKYQVIGVNFLFGSLVLIVFGSFAGEWAAIHRWFDNLSFNFWFGHQGYEYVDLGRFWQIYLAVGLVLWVILVIRGLTSAFKKPSTGPTRTSVSDYRSLLFLVGVSTLCIGLFYGAGLMWGEHTNIAIMNYWRWWVVHLWVEGVFEVFATTLISVLFVQMGLLRVRTAIVMVLVATIIFLIGGVLGTLHHLYFSGTPTSAIAIGASFSALEVVPLMVVGFEAFHHKKVERQAPWIEKYHWPFLFFSAVLFWNFLGAGVFGFLINPPIALYYMQGMNLTANHGHAALFGVYGMLGLGLTLYCLLGLTDFRAWNHKLLRICFWSLNVGMAMMTFMSLLPQGLLQTYASVSESYAYARSAEFIHSPIMETLVWMRVPGDIVFGVGVFAFALFVYQAFQPRGALATRTEQHS